MIKLIMWGKEENICLENVVPNVKNLHFLKQKVKIENVLTAGMK